MIGVAIFILLLCFIINTSWLIPSSGTVSRLRLETYSISAENDDNLGKYNVSRETLYNGEKRNKTIILQVGLISILVGYLFIGLFDHYYWTLQQGQLVLWLVFGSIVSLRQEPL
jgi:hypothetical protein